MIIQVQAINKSIDKKSIIQQLSLSIEKQEIVAIMGPSGAGKSTLLNLMSGLDQVDSGKILINQQDLTKLKEPKLTKFRAQNIGYIFQDYKLIDYLNLKENILLMNRINHQKINHQKYQEIATQLGLSNYLKNGINQLSGGQKQRVAIARALIGNNQLIFADEPTGALDIFTRDEIMKLLIENVQTFKKTLIIVTHDPFVATYAQRIVFLKAGEIESVHKKMTVETISDKLLELQKNV